MKKKIEQKSAGGTDYLRGQKEAATYARVSRRCISEWQVRRIIPYIKVGRKCVLFRKRDIDAALDRHLIHAVD